MSESFETNSAAQSEETIRGLEAIRRSDIRVAERIQADAFRMLSIYFSEMNIGPALKQGDFASPIGVPIIEWESWDDPEPELGKLYGNIGTYFNDTCSENTTLGTAFNVGLLVGRIITLQELDRAPAPVDMSQWPEARSFRRVYSRNPFYQARLVMSLFGYRQESREYLKNEDTANDIDNLILAFYNDYPEFMQDGYIPPSDVSTEVYRMDDRLRYYMSTLPGFSDANTAQ